MSNEYVIQADLLKCCWTNEWGCMERNPCSNPAIRRFEVFNTLKLESNRDHLLWRCKSNKSILFYKGVGTKVTGKMQGMDNAGKENAGKGKYQERKMKGRKIQGKKMQGKKIQRRKCRKRKYRE